MSTEETYNNGCCQGYFHLLMKTMNLCIKNQVPLLMWHMHYCPGCYHSLVHKLIMEVVEEMDIQEQTIGIAPVGCSVFAYDYMDIDMQEAAHGQGSCSCYRNKTNAAG